MSNPENAAGDQFTRRDAIKKCFLVLGAGITGLLAAKGKSHAGWGRCSQCNCPQYRQAYGTDLCSNCGHQYSAHWNS